MPLAEFDHLTRALGHDTVAQVNRDYTGVRVTHSTTFTSATYNVAMNKFKVSGSCFGSGNQCQASYSWLKHPPNFDGTGYDSSCMKSYPDSIFNYHNHAGCASDSGLFTWTHGGASDAKPQLLGHYQGVADEVLILVR